MGADLKQIILNSCKIIGCAWLLLGLSGRGVAQTTDQLPKKRSADFIISGMMAIDLRTGKEWMRCSVGQQFEEGQCKGDILRLDQSQASEAAQIASRQLGGIWRLPNREELEYLVCESCEAIKIDSYVFPNSEAEPYWTGQKNWISPKNYWSVNFMTGHSYGRFFGYQKLAVRLVKDR